MFMQTRQKNIKGKNNQGFTLIELLIVIAIIGLLATLAIVSLTTAQRKARDTKRVADVKQLQNAVELFYSEGAAYPLTTTTTNETWAEFSTAIDTYITNVPIDPTNSDANSYVYTYGANTLGTEYFIGAQLEDKTHDSLTGDDDVSYAAANSGWTSMDAVESDDAAQEIIVAYDCGATVLDATGGKYCVSE